MKKIKFYLQLWDFVWSVPLAIFTFLLFSLFGHLIFGDGFAGYDPAFIQAAIYAGLILVIGNGVVWIGIYFNWRKIFRYHSGHWSTRKEDNHTFWFNKSKIDFDNITPIQRICVTLFLYCFYFLAYIFILSLLV
jgi:hypothetical protein